VTRDPFQWHSEPLNNCDTFFVILHLNNNVLSEFPRYEIEDGDAAIDRL